MLQPHIFRAEFVSPKQHLSFNVCCFCQGGLLGLCTASPSLDPHFYLFCSPMDSPSVPHLRRGHISFGGGESYTNLCCSIFGFLVCWVDGCLVRWLCELQQLILLRVPWRLRQEATPKLGWQFFIEHFAHPKRVGFINNAVGTSNNTRICFAPV